MLEYNTNQIFQRMCCPGLDLDRHVQYETLNPTPSGLVRLVSTKKAKLFFHSLNHRRSGCTREGEGLLHYSLQLQATCRNTGRQKKVPDPIEEAMAHIPEALWCNENLNAVKYHLLDSTPNVPSFFYQDFLPSKPHSKADMPLVPKKSPI
jgi:hypothetical protein